jgi:hypothetical protein
MAEFVDCKSKRHLLLAYGKPTTDMMELLAYAFPTHGHDGACSLLQP